MIKTCVAILSALLGILVLVSTVFTLNYVPLPHKDRGVLGIIIALLFLTSYINWRKRPGALWIQLGARRLRHFWWLPGNKLQLIFLQRRMHRIDPTFGGPLSSQILSLHLSSLHAEARHISQHG